jgi:hypothetical protein
MDRVESPSKFLFELTIDTIAHSLRCEGHFRVEEAGVNGEDSNDLHNEGNDTQGDDRRSATSAGHDDGDDSIVDEEIISPSSYVMSFICEG